METLSEGLRDSQKTKWGGAKGASRIKTKHKLALVEMATERHDTNAEMGRLNVLYERTRKAMTATTPQQKAQCDIRIKRAEKRLSKLRKRMQQQHSNPHRTSRTMTALQAQHPRRKRKHRGTTRTTEHSTPKRGKSTRHSNTDGQKTSKRKQRANADGQKGSKRKKRGN